MSHGTSHLRNVIIPCEKPSVVLSTGIATINCNHKCSHRLHACNQKNRLPTPEKENRKKAQIDDKMCGNTTKYRQGRRYINSSQQREVVGMTCAASIAERLQDKRTIEMTPMVCNTFGQNTFSRGVDVCCIRYSLV